LAEIAFAEGYCQPGLTPEVVSRTVSDFLFGAIVAITEADGHVSNREYELFLGLFAEGTSLDGVKAKLATVPKRTKDDSAIPNFFEAIIERDRKLHTRDSIDAMLAFYSICVAFTVIDRKTSSAETAAIFDSYLYPLIAAVTEAGVASHSEVEGLLYGPRSVSDFCKRLEADSSAEPPN
jgi:hypothetical protein